MNANYDNLSFGVTLGFDNGSWVFQFNEDRFRHTAIIGRTGSGKSNHILQMEREDIRNGAGIAIIAAHEEDALYPLMCVPEERMGDVIIVDPTNTRFLPCMNPLDVDDSDEAAVSKAIDDTVELLKCQCQSDWAGPRFAHLARLALEIMFAPGYGGKRGIEVIERLYTNSDYAHEATREITDMHLLDQWCNELRNRDTTDHTDMVQWFLSKLKPFTSDRVLRNIFAPDKKTVDIKSIVDEGKILVAVIPESRIGHDAAFILRKWLLMQLEDAIMQRRAAVDSGPYGICGGIVESRELDPFFVYVDEFGEHASREFAALLAESRKYRVGFTLAFQNLEQLRVIDPRTGSKTDELLDAFFGNIGTIVCYPVGIRDASSLVRQMGVMELQLLGIERYRPLARVCQDNDMRIFSLDVEEKPAPDNPSLPEELAEEQIIHNRWWPVRKDKRLGRAA
ncbi:MAG: type IV secretory system conjugative DNA transfer family protein [Coriobacteriales bacterium]|jgi:hypothetical protein